MKRLNKKGFTLVELLAAIVILAVLMLVGAQAVGTILNNSNANSLLNSLNTAGKQASLLYTEGNLPRITTEELEQKIAETGATSERFIIKYGIGNDLKSVLTYNDNQYEIRAFYLIDGSDENIVVTLAATPNGKFKNVKCNHGNLSSEVDGCLDPTGTEKLLIYKYYDITN